MILKFLAKSLDIYSTLLTNNISVKLKLNDVFDFPIEDARRILKDFPNDFYIINKASEESNEMPKAIIKYIIVNKRNNVLF